MEATAVIDAAGALTTSGITGPVPWWSFTKTVLATAALRCVDEGLLSLDAPMPAARFTLRQVLRHEAGLPDYGTLPAYHADVAAGKAPWPVDRLLRALDAERLRYEPGMGWAYSNIGYLRVAQAIARVSAMPLQDALDRLVFQPCKLTTARVACSAGDLRDVCMGGVTGYDPGWVYHGLVVGTVADAARLLRAVVTGGLLQPETLAAMLEERALPQFRDGHPDPAYGLGLMMWASNPREHPLGHKGEGPGSRIAVFAQGRKAAAVWMDTTTTPDPETCVSKLLSD